MKTLSLIPNGQFDPAQGFTGWSAFLGPTIPTAWLAAKPANGSGGAITFPTFSGYTPTPYTPPSTNAPAGDAVFIGWNTVRKGLVTYNVAVEAGRPYTFSFWYAGNSAQSSLAWVLGATVALSDGIVGDLDVNNATHPQPFSPTAGWLQKTITFTTQVSATITLSIYAIGSDGTSGTGTTLTGAVTVAPVLIANMSLTTPSTGRRSFPVGALPSGSSTGTVAAGNDPRIPNRDATGLWHPRTERFDLTVAGSLSVGSGGPGIPIPSGYVLRSVWARVGSKSTGGTDKAVVDVLLGGTSIFASSADQCSITTASPTSTGVSKVVNVPVSTATVLTVNVSTLVGTASDLTVTIWVEVP